MITTLLRHLLRIRNRDRIPKLPRGMYASHYDQLDADSARVAARLGIRDPNGMRKAMKRYKVTNVDDLVAKLEHQQYQRDLRANIRRALERFVGGSRQPPGRKEIIAATRPRSAADIELSARLRRYRREMRR
ncbi:MAG: hypothetical protein SF123_07585 [Chloroflexota bacterium]|nr:hypothetical protein [Chloroflexota bacterium]